MPFVVLSGWEDKQKMVPATFFTGKPTGKLLGSQNKISSPYLEKEKTAVSTVLSKRRIMKNKPKESIANERLIS